MNRKHLSLLALIVALILACAPLSALAESYSSAALTLKNPTVSYGDETHSAEIALTLDGGINMEDGVGRLLLSLTGGDQTALSGGANWDGESIIAGLDGMKKSVKLPLAALTEQFQSEMGGLTENFAALAPQVNALKEALTALWNYAPSEETQNQLVELAVNALNLEYAPNTTFEYDDETTLTGDCYDFKTTNADLIKLFNDCRALDPELDTLISNLTDAFTALVTAAGGEISTSVNTDENAAITGYVLTTENSDFVISYDLSESADAEALASFQIVVFSSETDMHVNMYISAPDDSGKNYYMIADVITPKGEGDITASLYIDNIEENGKTEGEGCQIVFATNNASSSVNVTFNYFEDYLYDDELYEDSSAFSLTYMAGEAVTDETGTTYPGKLILDVEANGETVSISLETELRLYASEQAFQPSSDVVDLSDPTDEDMNALNNDLMSVYGSAAAVIAAAPGMSDLLAFLGLQ